MAYRPITVDSAPSTRVSDAQRDAAVETLTGHVASGRLALDDFDVRAARVYAAVSHADLSSVFSDLPAGDLPAGDLPAPQPTPPRAPASRELPSRELLTWASVGVLCLAIWAVTSIATGSFLYPWPIWVIGPWGAMLALQRLTGAPMGCAAGRTRR